MSDDMRAVRNGPAGISPVRAQGNKPTTYDRSVTAWANFSLTNFPSSLNSSTRDRVSRQLCAASSHPKCQACMFADIQICCAAECEFTTNFAPSSNSSVRMSAARSDSTPSTSRSASSSFRNVSAARRPNSFSSIARQPFQGVAGQPERLPVGQHLRTEAAVEVDRRRVPVQHLPVHPAALLPHRDPRQLDQQGLPDTLPAEVGRDEEILEVDSPAPDPGRVGVEIEGEARRRSVPFRHQAEVTRLLAEAVPEEVLLRRHHLLW